MDIFYWIIAVLLIGMGGFVGYSNWKIYFASRKLREHFLQTHENAKVIKMSMTKIWIYVFVLLLGFGMGFYLVLNPNSNITGSSALANGMVYVGLGVFALAMVGEAMMDGQIIATEDAFVFEDKLIRFKNVRNVDVQKGFFKTSMLYLTQSSEMPVAKNTAIKIQELWLEWKKDRKESAHTSRKERRAKARQERGK